MLSDHAYQLAKALKPWPTGCGPDKNQLRRLTILGIADVAAVAELEQRGLVNTDRDTTGGIVGMSATDLLHEHLESPVGESVGTRLSAADFAEIVKRHNGWLDGSGRRADLTLRDCSQLEFPGVRLRKAKLTGANLSHCGLADADLRDVDLFGANLKEADLRNADLSGADLRGATLCGCNLTGAKLANADLSVRPEKS